MNQIEFEWLTDSLAKVLTGKGVFAISAVITIIFVAIYYKKRSRQLLNSLPGLFTSLGLLGTFVAICNSLDNISEDTLEIDVIIRNLVPAFTSSVAGLISAFIATVGCKIWYSFEDHKLDQKVNNKSPEECLFEISNQLVEQDKKNEVYNDRLNTTIGQQSKILKQFINDFVKRMDDIFTKMHGQIEQNIKDFGEEQFKKCADTLETLTDKMSTLSTGLLEEQKTNVQQMIDGTNTELLTISNTVKEQIASLCTQMTNALSTLRSSQDERLTAIISNYDTLSERLANQNSDFAEKLTSQLNEEYAKVQRQNTDSLQQMIDLKDSYKVVNEEILSSTTEMNQKITADLQTSIGGFVNTLHSSISTEIETLRVAISESVKSLKESYAYISDHVANIKGNYESASQSFQDAVNNAHRMNESQDKVLNTINESMQHVIRTNEKVEQVITILDERQESLENLISQINEISTTIETLQKLESQLNRIASK